MRTGLAFKFDAAVHNVVVDLDTYEADYTNAAVVIDGEEYKLITMGAVVNNQGESDLELSDVDEGYVLNIVAEKAFNAEASTVSFAIRTINIPDGGKDTAITARPYYVFEKDGEEIVVYGDPVAKSDNEAAE